jgi:hypothetical protein
MNEFNHAWISLDDELPKNGDILSVITSSGKEIGSVVYLNNQELLDHIKKNAVINDDVMKRNMIEENGFYVCDHCDAGTIKTIGSETILYYKVVNRCTDLIELFESIEIQ